MREDTTGMSAETIPVIPAVMISTGVVSWANPPASGQQVTLTATPGRASRRQNIARGVDSRADQPVRRGTNSDSCRAARRA